MYGQINYQEKLGNSNLTLAEADCFGTSFCNTLEKVGVSVDPPTLNTFFTNNHVYTYDATDHANDDLYWNSITKYCPQLVVDKTGGAGWPTSDLAIVEFRYKSHTGAMVTHFCAVNHAADHSIIDSYDGQVKTPAQYEHVYGQPIAWATYVFHAPDVTPPETPHAAPVSAPAATAPALQPAPVAPKQIVLPKTNNGKYYGPWHVYKPGGPYTLPYAIGALNVYQYGPLTYDILGNPAPNIYLIQTQDFGEVAIYAGPDTVAQFPGSGHGEGDPATETGIPVSEVVPAPQTQAQAQEQPEKTAEPAEPGIVYVRFKDENDQPKPMNVVTNKDTHWVNFVSGTILDELPQGTPFVAVGKATLPNNDTYYMNDNDFDIADETQRTPITVGIKTVDLRLASAPAPAPAPASAEQGESAPVEPPALAATNETPSPALDLPNLPWQRSMRPFMNPQDYVVKGARNETLKITDFATGEQIDVAAGRPVKVGGKFQFGGHYYYRAQSSIDKGTWYGFPVTSLAKQDANNTPFETNDDINQLEDEINDELDQESVQLSKPKHAAIKAGGSAAGFLARLRKK